MVSFHFHLLSLPAGEEGKGLSYMFAMMNEARINIGVVAAALGWGGYEYSLQYSKDRRQGRDLMKKDPHLPQRSIIHHSDVKRMLLAQKAYVEGTLICFPLIS
jgi:alkylation response protein AidB-like acyl-CoA dehydrogenase